MSIWLVLSITFRCFAINRSVGSSWAFGSNWARLDLTLTWAVEASWALVVSQDLIGQSSRRASVARIAGSASISVVFLNCATSVLAVVAEWARNRFTSAFWAVVTTWTNFSSFSA